MSFLSKQPIKLAEYIMQAASSGLKYKARSGAKDHVYVPAVIYVGPDGVDIRSFVGATLKLHSITKADGKGTMVPCLKGRANQNNEGIMVNDGSCPFCDRIDNAWSIYSHRMELVKMTETDETKLKDASKNILRDAKTQEAALFLYLLIAVFKKTQTNEFELDETTKLPKYELKIIRMSSSRAEKTQKPLANYGMELAGSEIIWDYPESDEPMQLGSNVSTTILSPGVPNSAAAMYPDVLKRINDEASKFDLESIDKDFPEIVEMTNMEAQALMDKSFAKFDEWQIALETNPEAKYLEYQKTANKPELQQQQPNMQIPQNLDVNAAFAQIQQPQQNAVPQQPNNATQGIILPNMGLGIGGATLNTNK